MKQRIIRADADILAGMHIGSALSDNNIACNHGLSVRFFDAQPLCVTVASVLCRTDTFFMCKKLQV